MCPYAWESWHVERKSGDDWVSACRNVVVVGVKGAATVQKLGGSESGGARIEGAKRPRFEGEARIEGEAREKAGGGVWGGGSVSPSSEIFWNFELQIVQSGIYLNPKS